MLYSPGFWVIACCDLWPLIRKAKQHIYEPKYICGQNWVKFPSSVFEIWCSRGFRVIVCCDLDLWPFDPKKPKQHIYESKYICGPNWVKFPSLLFETHALTHRWTDTLTVCLRRHRDTVFQWWRRYKMPWQKHFTHYTLLSLIEIHLGPNTICPFLLQSAAILTCILSRTHSFQVTAEYWPNYRVC